MHLHLIYKKQKLKLLKNSLSQKLSESLIVHPYHTAIVGGDSLVLERTDFSARIAYVDYDGGKVYQEYLTNKPKSSSEKIEFVKKNAPKVVAGIDMIADFFTNLRKKSLQELETKKSSMIASS
jgi:aspartate aminotransferase